MRCENCPAHWIESNESTYPPEDGCYYGEDQIRYFSTSDDYGCLKRLKTIERDMKYEKEKFSELCEFENECYTQLMLLQNLSN